MSNQEEKEKSTKKQVNPYIISKRTPTKLSSSVKPVINELNDCVYVASGHLVNFYSLTTNILISTLRSKRQQPQPEGAKVPKGDVHSGNIISMKLIGQNKVSLGSFCHEVLVGDSMQQGSLRRVGYQDRLGRPN